MQLTDIIAKIEEEAPFWAQASWDHSGLQVAAERDGAICMAVALDPQPATVAAAIDHGADFILTHHPLALKPALPDRVDNYFRALKLLLQANVPLYAAHTSLDVNPAGPAAWFADQLGLIRRECLDYTGKTLGDVRLGYGLAGSLPRPMPGLELVRQILNLLGVESAMFSGPQLPDVIERIAYCGGSGSSMSRQAEDCKAQLFITGDVRHHAALDSPVTILDVGHHSLESRMMAAFADLLRARLPAMEVFYLSSISPFRLIRRADIR